MTKPLPTNSRALDYACWTIRTQTPPLTKPLRQSRVSWRRSNQSRGLPGHKHPSVPGHGTPTPWQSPESHQDPLGEVGGLLIPRRPPKDLLDPSQPHLGGPLHPLTPPTHPLGPGDPLMIMGLYTIGGPLSRPPSSPLGRG